MKTERGITLISLIVYVIVMLIVVTIIGTITSYFYANVNDKYTESKDQDKESTLEMYLTNDLKNKEISIKTADYTDIPEEGSNTINLLYEDASPVLYTITDDGIYRNSVKIYNKEQTDSMIFKVINIDESNVIQENVELQILKGDTVFKSYIIDVESRAVYD